jgi:signal transduction histidine kinase
VTAAVAAAGWLGTACLAVRVAGLRRRLELLARAEHELRGPATVIALVAERLRREPASVRHAAALEVQLDRLRAGLADLRAAGLGRRGDLPARVVELERLARDAVGGWAPALAAQSRDLRMEWLGGAVSTRAAPGRLAQALGNILANAVEHGDGPVVVTGEGTADGVRLEVRNAVGQPPPASGDPARGRGLSIAAAAASEAGGSVRFERRGDTAVATLDVPANGA